MTARERTMRASVAAWCIAVVCSAPSLALAQTAAPAVDADTPVTAPPAHDVAPLEGAVEHEIWQLFSGVGIGIAGHHGRHPPNPGAALHFSIGFLVSPIPQLTLGTEIESLVTLREHLNEHSIPYGGRRGLRTNSLGFGATFMLRLLPRSGRFFVSGLFRAGMQFYRTGVEEDRPLFTVYQPGIEAGMRWRHTEFSLRALFGVPQMYDHADLYTVMLTARFRIAGGR